MKLYQDDQPTSSIEDRVSWHLECIKSTFHGLSNCSQLDQNWFGNNKQLRSFLSGLNQVAEFHIVRMLLKKPVSQLHQLPGHKKHQHRVFISVCKQKQTKKSEHLHSLRYDTSCLDTWPSKKYPLCKTTSDIKPHHPRPKKTCQFGCHMLWYFRHRFPYFRLLARPGAFRLTDT